MQRNGTNESRSDQDEVDELRKLLMGLNEQQRRQVRAYIERVRMGQSTYSGPQNGVYTGEFPDRIGGWVSEP
ncbi:hypothetical protein [Alicyclobacillus sp.]|uniref:hypothetical protein n=1 Tax=Alicyclobacillus sp. TaxID=61169 RepID=UPI0025C38AC8|nr:hypothetical protein [Alicyclobacillus sp.]MCL6515331.1 hypothetical protein [Alicyclobacillus sp.]